MPPLDPASAARLVNLVGALILLTAFFMLAARQVYAAIHAYAMQSILLAIAGVIMAYATGIGDLYLVALITVITKGILITYFLRYVARRVEAWRELTIYINIPASLLIGGILVLVAYFATFSLPVQGTFATKPSLAIAVAVMLIGIFLMVSRAQAILQIVGLVTLENGLFLGALAVSYGTPLIVEFGIFFDIFVGVIVMGILVTRISQELATTSTTDLRRLRG